MTDSLGSLGKADSLEDRIRKAREEVSAFRRKALLKTGPAGPALLGEYHEDRLALLYASGLRLATLLEERDRRDAVPTEITIADLRRAVADYSEEVADLKRQLAEMTDNRDLNSAEVRRLDRKMNSIASDARQAERERCAKVCEDRIAGWEEMGKIAYEARGIVAETGFKLLVDECRALAGRIRALKDEPS